MHKAATRTAQPARITVIGQEVPASTHRVPLRRSRSIRLRARTAHIGIAPRQGPSALPLSTEARRDTDRISTATMMELAASRIVDDNEDRNIRIEASVLAAVIAFAVMAHLLLWVRS